VILLASGMLMMNTVSSGKRENMFVVDISVVG
jgi:hypothetical protein